MRNVLLLLTAFAMSASCVSKKKFTALEEQNSKTEDRLSSAKMELAACRQDKENARNEIEYLKSSNYQLMKNVGDLATLSRQEASNLQKSLESIREKEMTINSLQQAVNRRDSVTFALVTRLKGATVGLDDEDISINVEKGVVYVSISDKLLFDFGSYKLSKDAQRVLAKVAKVLNNQPDIEFMVEGHTDDKMVKETAGYQDNWELSVQRAASVVRSLQNDFEINPKRMTAAGKAQFHPVSSNDSEEGRAKNRRTRIVILPKLDEFYGLIEDGMK